MKNEDRLGTPRVRIAILGNPNVGKSALTVRYLTRRFIGEYRSRTDLLYRQTVTIVDPTGLHRSELALDVEIVDVSCSVPEEGFPFPADQVQWADACLVVYSITDAKSLQYAAHALARLKELQGAPSAALVANKADLEHLREVPESEGSTLAAQHGIPFCEVSVAENSPALYRAFERVLLESRGRPTKPRKFSVSKMLGTLIGATNAIKQQQGNHQNQHGLQQGLNNGGLLQSSGGTVVPCNKAELHKSRVLKRRQNFTAAASL